jgi:hypothetical protein
MTVASGAAQQIQGSADQMAKTKTWRTLTADEPRIIPAFRSAFGRLYAAARSEMIRSKIQKNGGPGARRWFILE